MTDFFDLSSDNFVNGSSQSQKKTDPNIYNPDPNAHNGSYKSVFRFIPYVFDKSKSKYTKYSAKFWNPLTKEALYVDCPSNVEKPSILWDLETIIRSFKNEEPELHEQMSSLFSRWHTHHSPVYIKKDPQRPELEGTIKIFKFSAQINGLIEAQIKPEEDELLDSVSSVNPYHLLEGKDFLCVVGKKTKQFRDWSKSKFMDDVTPFMFKIGDKNVVVENNEKSVKLVQEFMKKNTPEMDQYFHQEWDESTYEKVAEAIIAVITNQTVLKMLLDRTRDQKMKEILQSKLSGSPKARPAQAQSKAKEMDDDLEFTSDEDPFNEPDMATSSKASDESESDDYDSLFADL